MKNLLIFKSHKDQASNIIRIPTIPKRRSNMKSCRKLNYSNRGASVPSFPVLSLQTTQARGNTASLLNPH